MQAFELTILNWIQDVYKRQVLLGIIVALVNAAGGSAAFGRWASQNIKTRCV